MIRQFKYCLPVIIVILVYSNMNGQTHLGLTSKADSLYEMKESRNAAEYYEKAFEIQRKFSSLMELASINAYNAACCRALIGNKERAFRHLNHAIDNGWRYLNETKNDSNLISLHKEKKWKSIIAKIEKKLKQYESGLNKVLMKELKEIKEKDQFYRKEIIELANQHGWEHDKVKEAVLKMQKVDSLNLVRIEAIIQEYGYPGKSLVGEQKDAAFLVIQHVADPRIREKYLPLLKKAADKGELPWGDLALLIDRVKTDKGEKQIYGTQLFRNKQNKHELYPIQDEANVDKRRAAIGLPPLAEYLKLVAKEYHTEVEPNFKTQKVE